MAPGAVTDQVVGPAQEAVSVLAGDRPRLVGGSSPLGALTWSPGTPHPWGWGRCAGGQQGGTPRSPQEGMQNSLPAGHGDISVGIEVGVPQAGFSSMMSPGEVGEVFCGGDAPKAAQASEEPKAGSDLGPGGALELFSLGTSASHLPRLALAGALAWGGGEGPAYSLQQGPRVAVGPRRTPMFSPKDPLMGH